MLCPHSTLHEPHEHKSTVLADNIPIWTRAYTNLRPNSNLQETTLNIQNVNKNQFGKITSRTVEGQVYAQVLYIPNLVMKKDNKAHNVLFIATMGNNVYAFDADDTSTTAAPLWERNVGAPLPIIDKKIGAPSAHCTTYTDIQVEVGIVSTPVIDQATKTMYFIAVTKESDTPYVIKHRLYAVDITSGEDRANSPVVIEGQYPGTGDGSVNGIITFTSLTQNQRLSLTLADNGVLYFGFGSYCTAPIYHGWLFGYDKTTLQRKMILCTTPSKKEGSIWQSGLGLIYEAPYLYAISANGYFNPGTDWGNSYLKIDPSKVDSNGHLINGVVDYFTPYNWEELWDLDLDLGTAGPLIIPGTNNLFGCSKQGYCYVVDKNNMGKNSATTNNNIQYFKPNPSSGTDYPTLTMGTHGALTGWNANGRTRVYVWPVHDVLKSFNFVNGQMDLNNVEMAPVADAKVPVGFPGGMLSLSANGLDINTGIVWAIHSTQGSANREIRAGVLRAYVADNIGQELWNSNQVPCRDSMGNLVKFSHVVVTNGKVIVPSMPSYPNRMATVNIYGLLSTEQANKQYPPDSCCVSNPCGEGTACCSGACYNPKIFYCSYGALCQRGQTCNANSPDPCLNCPNSCCFGKCYDAKTQICNGTTICPTGLMACADGCYDPSKYTCAQNLYPYLTSVMPPPPSTPSASHTYPVDSSGNPVDSSGNPIPRDSASISISNPPHGSNPHTSQSKAPNNTFSVLVLTAALGFLIAIVVFVST